MATRSRQRQPTPEAQHERQIRGQEHGSATSAAMQGVGQAFDPKDLVAGEFIDTATDLDVDRELPEEHPKWHDLDNLLAAESSRQLEFGNIPRKYWREECIMDRARAILAKMEFVQPNGLGKKCGGDTRRRMTAGRQNSHVELTDDLAREIDAAYRQIGMKRSKSISGWFMSKIADMQVVTRSEGFTQESGGGGWFDRISSALRGG